MKTEKYQAIIDRHLQALEFPSTPKHLYDPLRYFLQLGGKRMRPSLTLLACKMYGKEYKKAVDAAISIELFHNFTLIHDDIMDEAPLRRGQKTIHEKWNRDVAILSGDVLYTKSFQLMLNYCPALSFQLITLLTQTAQEVCEGQQLDMDFEESNTISLEEYLEMIRLKTSVLLGAALNMGALIGGEKDVENLKNIYDFGVHIGLAFQVQDDFLDLYGNPQKFGKQVGGDILSNKKTFLLLKAFELADKNTKQHLKEGLNSYTGLQKIDYFRNEFEKLGVKDTAKQQKEMYYQKALENMEKIQVPKQNKKELLALAKMLMCRDF